MNIQKTIRGLQTASTILLRAQEDVISILNETQSDIATLLRILGSDSEPSSSAVPNPEKETVARLTMKALHTKLRLAGDRRIRGLPLGAVLGRPLQEDPCMRLIMPATLNTYKTLGDVPVATFVRELDSERLLKLRSVAKKTVRGLKEVFNGYGFPWK